MKIELELDDTMFNFLPDSVQDSLINECAVATGLDINQVRMDTPLMGGYVRYPTNYNIELSVETAPDREDRLYVLHQGVTTKVGTMEELNRYVDPESILMPRFYKLGNEVDVEVKTHTSYEVKK